MWKPGKNKNVRDHLFVVNGVMNNVINGKGDAIDLQIYDNAKCFDKMDFKETMNDLFAAGIQNDDFALLCELNKTAKISIKTPVGLTDPTEFNEIIMQGGVWGPLECSIQMDKIGKECLDCGKYLYKYKECVDVPPPAMIDDVIAVARCGECSVMLNSFINSRIKPKNLRGI